MSLLKSFYLFIKYQILHRRFNIKIATTPLEKEQVYKFRYKIYRKELQHSFLDHLEVKDDMLCDEYDNEDNTVSFYIGDINNIIGTLRISSWKSDQLPKKIKDKYLIPSDVIKSTTSIGEIRFYQMRKDMRNSSLGTMLLFNIYPFISTHPEFASNVYFCDCQPGLVPSILKFGFYPYSSEMLYKGYGILQIPLVLPTFDLDYLKKNHSYYYFIAKYYFNIYKKIVTHDISSDKRKNFTTILPYVSLTLSNDQMIFYREQFQNDLLKKHYDLIMTLLDFHLIIPLKADTVVLKKDIVDFDVFLILSGKLQVIINNQPIAVLTPGKLVGELALINPDHQRQAEVIAIESSEILLIPHDFFSKLSKTNLKMANAVLLMLCQNLGDKLIQANNLSLNKKNS